MEKRDTLTEVTAAPKGLLDPTLAKQKLRLARLRPSAELAPFVEHHWIVEWDLRGEAPYVQRTLPYPCVNMVFARGTTAIFGVMRGTFEYTLVEAGRVLGVRFRPGAFRAFSKGPVGKLTDETVDVATIFGLPAAEAEASVLGAEGDKGAVLAAEAIVRRALPEADPMVEIVGRVIDRVADDASIVRVDQLAELAGFGVRDLQRLFVDYVGVSPKWVIRRARLHEVAYRLGQGGAVDLTRLAHDLGYFDQAHLARDFKAVVGRSPSSYQRGASG